MATTSSCPGRSEPRCKVASQQKTIDYIMGQCADAGTITSKKMFGEYALYCDTKVVAFVCDDQLS